jgi:hypothetical protein
MWQLVDDVFDPPQKKHKSKKQIAIQNSKPSLKV